MKFFSSVILRDKKRDPFPRKVEDRSDRNPDLGESFVAKTDRESPNQGTVKCEKVFFLESPKGCLQTVLELLECWSSDRIKSLCVCFYDISFIIMNKSL